LWLFAVGAAPKYQQEATTHDRRIRPVCQHNAVHSVAPVPSDGGDSTTKYEEANTCDSSEAGWAITAGPVFDTVLPGTTYVTVYASRKGFLNSEAQTFKHVSYKAAKPVVNLRNMNKFKCQ